MAHRKEVDNYVRIQNKSQQQLYAFEHVLLCIVKIDAVWEEVKVLADQP